MQDADADADAEARGEAAKAAGGGFEARTLVGFSRRAGDGSEAPRGTPARPLPWAPPTECQRRRPVVLSARFPDGTREGRACGASAAARARRSRGWLGPSPREARARRAGRDGSVCVCVCVHAAQPSPATVSAIVISTHDDGAAVPGAERAWRHERPRPSGMAATRTGWIAHPVPRPTRHGRAAPEPRASTCVHTRRWQWGRRPFAGAVHSAAIGWRPSRSLPCD